MFRVGGCVLRASERASRRVHLMEEVVTEQDFAEWKAFGKEETGKASFEGKGSRKQWRWGHKRCQVRRGRWAFRGRQREGGSGRDRESGGEIPACQAEENGLG